jgi:hypothetical protein
MELSRADESEVLWVKEEDNVFFSLELVEREIFYHLAVNDRAGIERRGWFSNKY